MRTHTAHSGDIKTHINFPASSRDIITSVLSFKKLHSVRQVEIFFESANCRFGEKLQNTNAPLII